MTREEAMTATVDKLRYWLAVDDGWKYEAGPVWQWQRFENGEKVCVLDSRSEYHPHPPTIDGAAKAMPDGWAWTRDNGKWRAHHPYPAEVRVDDTPDEITARYRLAVLCRLAEREATK